MARREAPDPLLREELEAWWATRPRISQVFTAATMREAVLGLMTGANYRILTERTVREKLHVYHSWLLQLLNKARKECGTDWRRTLLRAVLTVPGRHKLAAYLRFWLIGLTRKTAQNTDVAPSEAPEFGAFLDEMLALCDEVARSARWAGGNIALDLRNCATGERQSLSLGESLWLTQIVGASTLTARGANKAVFGKRLERIFLRGALECLGFQHDSTYWLAIGRDELVEREADAEVETKRGRLRIDIGLIGKGNQEVGEDKLNRVGEHGIVIVDTLGKRSGVGATAEKRRVKLIQIRHNFVLTEMYSHLAGKTKFELAPPPASREAIATLLARLPDSVFEV